MQDFLPRFASFSPSVLPVHCPLCGQTFDRTCGKPFSPVDQIITRQMFKPSSGSSPILSPFAICLFSFHPHFYRLVAQKIFHGTDQHFDHITRRVLRGRMGVVGQPHPAEGKPSGSQCKKAWAIGVSLLSPKRQGGKKHGR